MDVNDLRQIFGTISEAARALGVTRRTIYNWEAAGNVPVPYQALAREIALRDSGSADRPPEGR